MENQLRNHVRLALVKLREYNSLGEQQEQQLRKILSPGESIDLTIAKLLQYEPRNDYQLLIIMTFLSEFVGGTAVQYRSVTVHELAAADKQYPTEPARLVVVRASLATSLARTHQQVNHQLLPPQENGDSQTVAGVQAGGLMHLTNLRAIVQTAQVMPRSHHQHQQGTL